MAEFESNPVPFEVLGDETDTQRIGLELAVYAFDDPTFALDVVPRRFELKTLDELRGPGGGSFKIMRSDAKLTETPNLLDYRNVCKIYLDRKVVGAFLIQSRKTDFVNREEKAGEFWEISGGGLREWFHDAVVEPYGGVRSDSQSERVFSFASEQGDWYIPSDWDVPVIVQQYNLDPNPEPFGTAPAEWPDAPTANWIWSVDNDDETNPAPEGVNYFRYEFNIAELIGTKNYSVFAAAKDDFDIYLDGQRIIESRELDGYARTWRADFQLGPGDHILAARVRANGTGKAGLIAALFRAGDAAEETAAELLAVTDTTWVVNAYPDPAPGWTPGEIMLTLLAEAQARGVSFPEWLTPTFTSFVDSDGATWPVVLDWSFNIGTEYFDVISKLEELACDVWIDPETLELNMYAVRGVHRDVQSAAVQPIKFEIGRNVVRAEEEGTSDIKNALLMSTNDGWQDIADGLSGSIAKYGRIEGYVSTGASSAVSGDLAQTVFTARAQPETTSTYDIIDVDDARPHTDFFVGDWVLAPSAEDENVLASRHVMSIAIEEDEKTGRPGFVVEFDTIFQDLVSRYERWLKTTGDGTLGGTLANVSAGGGGGGGSPTSQNTQTGPMGLQGPAGPAGPPGEAYDYQGVWEAATNYATGQTVTWEGSQWLALAANVGSEPNTESSDWTLLIADGTVVFKRVASLDETVYPVEQVASNALVTNGTSATNTIAAEAGDLVLAAIMHRVEITLSSGWTSLSTLGPIVGDGISNRLTFAYLRVEAVGTIGLTVTGASSERILINLHVLRNSSVPVLDLSATQLILDAPAPPANAVEFTKGDAVTLWAALSSIWPTVAPFGSWTGTPGMPLTQGDQSVEQPRLVSAYDEGNLGSRYLLTPGDPGVVVFGAVTVEPASQYAIWEGPPGAEGAPGQDGASLIYQGAWSALTTYQPNDLVSHGGLLWITDEINLNDEPGVGTAWEEAGVGGGGGSLPSRTTAVYTTASLASNAEETGTLALAVGYRLLKIETSAPARVRLYAAVTYQIADASRAAGVDPTGDHGLIFDFVSTDTVLSAVLSPTVDGMSMEAPPSSSIPITVQNLAAVPAAILVTLTWISTE